jgi:hypothetical protein
MAACDICEITDYCDEKGFPSIFESLAACSYEDSTEYRIAVDLVKNVKTVIANRYGRA